MATAKLAALSALSFQILEFPIPNAMEGSAVIKVEAASICGSDQHFVKGTYDKPNNLGTNCWKKLSNSDLGQTR